jgi:translation initiation factor 6
VINLDISKTIILGNSSLGIFALATEKYAVVPFGIKDSSKKIISETLNINISQTTIANSVLVGTLIAGNSNTLFVPINVGNKEIENIKESLEDNVEIIEVDSKFTALANLIVMNDKGAIISDIFEKKAQNQIKDVLNVSVTVGSLLGSPLVGSIAMCTNRGALVHPLLSEEEIGEISSILRVRTDVCTINRGIPYPRVGILANSKGAVLGTDSTGPESMRVFEVLLAP